MTSDSIDNWTHCQQWRHHGHVHRYSHVPRTAIARHWLRAPIAVEQHGQSRYRRSYTSASRPSAAERQVSSACMCTLYCACDASKVSAWRRELRTLVVDGINLTLLAGMLSNSCWLSLPLFVTNLLFVHCLLKLARSLSTRHAGCTVVSVEWSVLWINCQS